MATVGNPFTLHIAPGAFYPPSIAPPPPPASSTIRRGDAVRITDAARLRCDLPSDRGIVRDIWLDAGKPALLVAVPTTGRAAEVRLEPSDVTKEA